MDCVELKALNGDKFSFLTFVGTGYQYKYDINSGSFSSNPYGDVQSASSEDNVTETFFKSEIGIVFIILCIALVLLSIAWLYCFFADRVKGINKL